MEKKPKKEYKGTYAAKLFANTSRTRVVHAGLSKNSFLFYVLPFKLW